MKQFCYECKVRKESDEFTSVYANHCMKCETTYDNALDKRATLKSINRRGLISRVKHLLKNN